MSERTDAVTMIVVPAGFEPIGTLEVDGRENAQLSRMQTEVGGPIDIARIGAVRMTRPSAPQLLWLNAAVHDTGMIDGMLPNARVLLMFGVDLYGPVVLFAVDPDDGATVDIPEKARALLFAGLNRPMN